MAGTDLLYNNVQLLDVQTRRMEQNCRYDESDTDLLYHQFVIRVEALVHTDISGGHTVIPASGAPTTAAESLEFLHAQLMHPRGDLTYQIDGVPIVQANSRSNDPNRDVKNGPRPLSCNISHVAGAKVIRIEYEIEANVVRCGGEVQTASGTRFRVTGSANVLNNRWSLEDTRDGNWYTLRQWEGTLRVAHADVNPQALRWMVIPPLQSGFRRESMRFLKSKDGLQLQYTIIDRERYAAAPSPATDWKAYYTQSTGPGGHMQYGEVVVRLTAPSQANKKHLVVRCAQVIEARLGNLHRQFKAKNEGGFHLLSAAITEVLDENVVEMRIRIRQVPKNPLAFLRNVYAQIGTPLDLPVYKPYRWLSVPTYDTTTPAGVFASYLQSPCDQFHSMVKPGTLAPTGVQPRPNQRSAPRKQFLQGHGSLPTTRPDVSQQHQDNPYTYIEIDSEYETETGNYPLPIAKKTKAKEDTVAIVKLHSGICYRTFYMRAERVGDWPDLPEPAESKKDRNDITETLIRSTISPANPETLPDGKLLLYSVEAEYVYALSRPPTTKEKLRAAAPPDLRLTPRETDFDGKKVFTSGRIE